MDAPVPIEEEGEEEEGGIPAVLRQPGEIMVITCCNVLWVEVGIVCRERQRGREVGSGGWGRRFGGTGSGFVSSPERVGAEVSMLASCC